MEIAEIKVPSFTLEKDSRGIFAISHGARRVEVGQMVTSNGRFEVPVGRKGIVVRIDEPYTDCHTSNVIYVHFKGYGTPVPMKFKDLLEFNPNPHP